MSYMEANAEFHSRSEAMTARYMHEAKNQTRVLRSQGKLAHAAHYDGAYARILASLRASDALRHGVREDI